ncbi:response regulator transcription factor [Microbacterium sp. NPDC089318]
MSVRVLIVDDQELFRDAIALTLARDERIGTVVAVAGGAEAVEHVRARAVDVVLMDIRMPGMDGIHATREVLRHRPGVRVVVLTTFELDEYVYQAIRAGASGFLTKDIAPSALADAVISVVEGGSAMSPSATRSLLEFVRRGAPSSPAAALAPLSAREQEVARALATGASNDQIARRLFLSENTVKTHVKSVLAKLGLPDRVHVVIWAYENGVLRAGG